MEIEEYKFDHFKNIDEVMYYFNYWYKEEDVYSINRYLSLKDFNYISNKYQELKEELEEINKMIEKCGFVNIEQLMLSYCALIAQQKGFINYLEDEKDRLARECSNIYEDSLGHTRLVNEDIFDEINDVLQKYREIIGDDK